jgi:hypothetical protein
MGKLPAIMTRQAVLREERLDVALIRHGTRQGLPHAGLAENRRSGRRRFGFFDRSVAAGRNEDDADPNGDEHRMFHGADI